MGEFLKKVDKTLRHHRRQVSIAMRGIRWNLLPVRSDRPIFIIGCSRAGTTLVYKTLSESREIGTLQRETHDFWSELHPLQEKGWVTHALAATDASDYDRDFVSRYFYSMTGKARFVDKNNQNGLCVTYLHALFPDARFVYVKRSPGDNVNSLIEGWGRPDEFANWSDDLPASLEIDGGRYRRWCFFLPDGWRDYIAATIEDVCAFQYQAINRSILSARSLVPENQWIEIFYEDIVRMPEVSFHKLFRQCNLSFDERLKRHTNSVLDKPYNAFSSIRLDKWKEGQNYEKILRILPSLKGIAETMGYTV